MSRVSFAWQEAGDPRSAAQLQQFFVDLRATTGTLGGQNLREEGLRARSFLTAEPPAEVIDTREIWGGFLLVPLQAWGLFPGAVLQYLPNITVAPNEQLLITGNVDFPSTPAGPVYGVPSAVRAEIRIGGSLNGAPWVDAFSEVWVEPATLPVLRIGTGLSTFGWYENTTGGNVTFDNIQIELQCSAQVRVGNGILIIERRRKV